ncbi:MAG: lipopolysaccharide assembly protein LapA domain-containing protein [candidate division Zixibacteria bacterium]
MEAKKVIFVLAVILAIVIMFQNTHMVTVTLLLWDFDLSLILLILLTTLIGFVLGYLVNSFKPKKR